jgi:hypothetical protein
MGGGEIRVALLYEGISTDLLALFPLASFPDS